MLIYAISLLVFLFSALASSSFPLLLDGRLQNSVFLLHVIVHGTLWAWWISVCPIVSEPAECLAPAAAKLTAYVNAQWYHDISFWYL